MFKSLTGVAASLAIALGITAVSATAQEGRLTVELNKVEESETGGCRAFFLFRNLTDTTLDGFEMSLAILNQEGVIDRLLSIDAAPLSVGRTTLKLFEIPETTCGSISEILLHDIPVCLPAGGSETDCFPMVDLVSRAAARLTM